MPRPAEITTTYIFDNAIMSKIVATCRKFHKILNNDSEKIKFIERSYETNDMKNRPRHHVENVVDMSKTQHFR